MENKAIKILSICLIALFTLAVLFFTVGLIVEYKKAPKVISETMNQFTSDVGVASEYYKPGTQQFSDVLRARIASNSTIAVVTISHGNDVIFAYPLSSQFITRNVTGQPAITASSSFVSVKNKEVVLNNEPYIVSSALYSLQPTVIYSYIRVSFLIILAGTLIAGIALMYLYLTEQKQEVAGESFDDEGMAQKLKESRLDFPEVAPSSSVYDEIDYLDEQENSDFDVYNLPEGSMDFPPVDEVDSSHGVSPMANAEQMEDSVLQQEKLTEQEAVVSVEEGLAEQMLPMGEEFTLEEESPEREFSVTEPEVDFTEIASSDFVADDYEDEFGLSSTELKDLQENNIDNHIVSQAKFAQEQNSFEEISPQSNETTLDGFSIDDALQGYEPPRKETSNEKIPIIDTLENVQHIETQDISQDMGKDGPTGLFSPITGFGWESYLGERLDSELIRSASSEEDIGLMIIRIQGLDKTDSRCHAIYDQLLEFYKFRDLIFEYGQDGFSCIVHSINVDGALDLAEQVYVAISKILEENGMNNEIGIGISTRSFRLIPGKRILLEAEQALQHAFEDPETAIVAFRVDPEKYRKYISEYADEEDQK